MHQKLNHRIFHCGKDFKVKDMTMYHIPKCIQVVCRLKAHKVRGKDIATLVMN